jgi:hypothetical protein
MDRTYRSVKAVARACLRLYPRRFIAPDLDGAQRGVVVHETSSQAKASE